jgi:hypothetical protein
MASCDWSVWVGRRLFVRNRLVIGPEGQTYTKLPIHLCLRSWLQSSSPQMTGTSSYGLAQSNSKHDFRVHKFILSLASPVFKDMFALPQPLDQTLDEQHGLPVVDVPEPPEALDIILRFIYPGVEPPKITKPSALTATLLSADKYDISSNTRL